MSGDLDEFDALFEEISAQRAETIAAPAAVAPAAAPATSAPAPAVAAPVAAPTASTSGATSEEDNGEKPMYERLGGIVRLLHDSLRELGYDRSLSDVASQITDAQGRLEYVATLTEQAANKAVSYTHLTLPTTPYV